jgi:hypothetical protein
MLRFVRGFVLVVSLAVLPGCGACGKKATPVVPGKGTGAEASAVQAEAQTDCEKMAEMICAIDGTSEEDCASSRENAKKAKTPAEQAACRSIIERNKPAAK